MPIPRETVAAYEAADYVIADTPELVLKIGVPSPRLDALLDRYAVRDAAYVTAANPLGEVQRAGENAAAHEALCAMVRGAGFPHVEGEGRDPEGDWPVEKGLLILGMSRKNAERLGRHFRQNAIVVLAHGEAPSLVLLRSVERP